MILHYVNKNETKKTIKIYILWTSDYFTFYVCTHFHAKNSSQNSYVFYPLQVLRFTFMLYVFYQHPRYWTSIISCSSSLEGKLERTGLISSSSTSSHCLFKVRMLEDSTSQRSQHGSFHVESSVMLNEFCRCRSLVEGDARHQGSPVTGDRVLSRFSPVSSLQHWISSMLPGLHSFIHSFEVVLNLRMTTERERKLHAVHISLYYPLLELK